MACPSKKFQSLRELKPGDESGRLRLTIVDCNPYNGSSFFRVVDHRGMEAKLIMWRGELHIAQQLDINKSYTFYKLAVREAFSRANAPPPTHKLDLHFHPMRGATIEGVKMDAPAEAGPPAAVGPSTTTSAGPAFPGFKAVSELTISGAYADGDTVIVTASRATTIKPGGLSWIVTGARMPDTPIDGIVETRPLTSLLAAKCTSVVQRLECDGEEVVVPVQNLSTKPVTIPKLCHIAQLVCLQESSVVLQGKPLPAASQPRNEEEPSDAESLGSKDSPRSHSPTDYQRPEDPDYKDSLDDFLVPDGEEEKSAGEEDESVILEEKPKPKPPAAAKKPAAIKRTRKVDDLSALQADDDDQKRVAHPKRSYGGKRPRNQKSPSK